MKLRNPILRQAENETGAAEPEETSTRKRVSKRDFLGPDGSVVDSMEEATGARYQLTFGGLAENFDMQFGDAGKPSTMFAVFGWHTKLGNVANTVLNADENKGNADAPLLVAEELKNYIAAVAAGQWREPGKAGGFAVNKDALAEAFVQYVESLGKPVDKAAVRQKIDDDPTWAKQARQIDAVSINYAKIVGKSAPKSVDDLLAGLGGGTPAAAPASQVEAPSA